MSVYSAFMCWLIVNEIAMILFLRGDTLAPDYDGDQKALQDKDKFNLGHRYLL